MRGAPFDRIGLYLDGVLLHAPFHTTDGQADNGSLTIFNGDLTEDMTLYRGRRGRFAIRIAPPASWPSTPGKAAGRRCARR